MSYLSLLSMFGQSSAPAIRLGTIPVLPFLQMPIFLTASQICSHLWLQGISGMGKSKFLAHYTSQLILSGQAVAIVDPHTDLAHDVLRILLDRGFFRRPEATAKLWYVDFSNPTRFVPFNVLKHTPTATTYELARNLVEATTRAWPSLGDGQAPTFENVLLASASVLIETGYPLTAITPLLTDRAFREQLLRHVTDSEVLAFFHQRFDRWGRERPLLIESALRRVFLLAYSPALRFSLGQRDNLLNFRRLLDEHISVIFNLGGLDEPTQRLLGCLISIGFEAAALSRAELPEQARRPYFLALEEFSTFSAQSEAALTSVLSRTRKFAVFLLLSHQTGSQLSPQLQGALQNTPIRIAMKLGREDAVRAAPHFGTFDPMLVKHVVTDDTQEARTHPLYFSRQETFERWARQLQSLHPREALLRLDDRTIKLRTPTVPPFRSGAEAFDDIRAHYAQVLLRPLSEILAESRRMPVPMTDAPAASRPAPPYGRPPQVTHSKVVPLAVSTLPDGSRRR